VIAGSPAAYRAPVEPHQYRQDDYGARQQKNGEVDCPADRQAGHGLVTDSDDEAGESVE